LLIVQKFGGTSVGNIDRIKNVARRAIATQKQGHDVVVVVSAMSGETNRLLGLAQQISAIPDERELDVIASTGEQVTIGLLALAIQAEGGTACSFTGPQVRILTDSAFARARIQDIDDRRVREALKAGKIAVVAGFQGVDVLDAGARERAVGKDADLGAGERAGGATHGLGRQRQQPARPPV